eukprot:553761-Pyramimonas_sp.AAC.2
MRRAGWRPSRRRNAPARVYIEACARISGNRQSHGSSCCCDCAPSLRVSGVEGAGAEAAADVRGGAVREGDLRVPQRAVLLEWQESLCHYCRAARRVPEGEELDAVPGSAVPKHALPAGLGGQTR